MNLSENCFAVCCGDYVAGNAARQYFRIGTQTYRRSDKIGLEMDFCIEEMTPADWPAVRAIYEEGLATGLASFETQAPAWETWDQGHLPVCRLVARQAGQVIGWAALSPFSKRKVYAGVAEVSLYVAGAARGQGVGRALLLALIDVSEAAGFWTLQSGIFACNSASLGLHQACGFREVGRRERIAQRDGIWHDTVLLERRSAKI